MALPRDEVSEPDFGLCWIALRARLDDDNKGRRYAQMRMDDCWAQQVSQNSFGSRGY